VASNNQIPVQLQPGTPENDKIAYINQNFRSMADAFNPLIMSDGTHNRVIVGRYVHDTGIYYGYFGFDEDGTLVKYEGVNPVTKKYGSYITKTGLDVIDELLA
jgi:hypothetical protein